MRQVDYLRGSFLPRLRLALLVVIPVTVLHMPVPTPVIFTAARRAARARHNLVRLRIRAARISGASFNVNIYADGTVLCDFRFRVTDVTSAKSLILLVGGGRKRTTRNRYRCDAETATCIVLRRLASHCRWHGLEELFGMHSSALLKCFGRASILTL
jgi:hypothetical protein